MPETTAAHYQHQYTANICRSRRRRTSQHNKNRVRQIFELTGSVSVHQWAFLVGTQEPFDVPVWVVAAEHVRRGQFDDGLVRPGAGALSAGMLWVASRPNSFPERSSSVTS